VAREANLFQAPILRVGAMVGVWNSLYTLRPPTLAAQ
jgi:hypothetical protein